MASDSPLSEIAAHIWPGPCQYDQDKSAFLASDCLGRMMEERGKCGRIIQERDFTDPVRNGRSAR